MSVCLPSSPPSKFKRQNFTNRKISTDCHHESRVLIRNVSHLFISSRYVHLSTCTYLIPIYLPTCTYITYTQVHYLRLYENFQMLYRLGGGLYLVAYAYLRVSRKNKYITPSVLLPAVHAFSVQPLFRSKASKFFFFEFSSFLLESGFA